MSETVGLLLPDGSKVRAEVEVRGEEEVGLRDAFDFSVVTHTIRTVAGSIRGALEPLLPDKVSVEFGLELAIENGSLAAIVAKGATKANFTIRLEWAREAEPGKEGHGA